MVNPPKNALSLTARSPSSAAHGMGMKVLPRVIAPTATHSKICALLLDSAHPAAPPQQPACIRRSARDLRRCAPRNPRCSVCAHNTASARYAMPNTQAMAIATGSPAVAASASSQPAAFAPAATARQASRR